MNIQQIKEKFTCLDYLGQPLRRTSAGWFIFSCPWREDKHPSLNVTPDGKVWHDQATGAKGGIIELVMADLNTKDLSRVCAAFDSSSFLSSRVFDHQKEKEVEGTAFSSFEVVPLKSRGLYAYLTKRRIDIGIAKQFLQEAHYSFQQREDGKYLYALAYRNDKGGYELRSEAFKGSTSPKGITTHIRLEDDPVVVFEGFMDMLSFATLCGEVRHNYVVLNSIVNVDAAIEALRQLFGTIYLCLDNDDAGRKASKRMFDALPASFDISEKFSPYKDVNDYLLHNSSL